MGLKEYLFGYKNEDKAVKYLEDRGFVIIKRNFRSKFGEIDIVASKGEILHFIEVKSTSKEYESIYRVTPAKLKKILKTIDFYMMKEDSKIDFQVDVITVNKNKITFIENITN